MYSVSAYTSLIDNAIVNNLFLIWFAGRRMTSVNVTSTSIFVSAASFILRAQFSNFDVNKNHSSDGQPETRTIIIYIGKFQEWSAPKSKGTITASFILGQHRPVTRGHGRAEPFSNLFRPPLEKCVGHI